MTQETQTPEAVALRMNQLTQWLPALEQVWPALAPLLEERRMRFVKQLIAADDEQRRGRIKELSDLLELPTRLQAELTELHRAASRGEV